MVFTFEKHAVGGGLLQNLMGRVVLVVVFAHSRRQQLSKRTLSKRTGLKKAEIIANKENLLELDGHVREGIVIELEDGKREKRETRRDALEQVEANVHRD